MKVFFNVAPMFWKLFFFTKGLIKFIFYFFFSCLALRAEPCMVFLVVCGFEDVFRHLINMSYMVAFTFHFFCQLSNATTTDTASGVAYILLNLSRASD